MPKLKHRLPEELKQKWIAAMASGEYAKTVGAYKREDWDGSQCSYCALGVLMEVAEVGPGRASDKFWMDVGAFDQDGPMKESFWFQISELNDQSFTFEPVIKFIQENM